MTTLVQEILTIRNKTFETVNKNILNTKKHLQTIDNLIAAGELRLHGDVLKADNSVELKTIYGNNGTITLCTIGLQGGRVPEHIHKDVMEYLICIKGSFRVDFANRHRVLSPAECASIPHNILHTVTALEDNSELVAVCVPEEIAYKNSMVK